MKIDPKKIRILFIDDEEFPVIEGLRSQGFDVERIADVDSLDSLCDGRYQVVFFDVRGIGEKLGGNGLDVLRYVAVHNPLIYRVVYSARPFEGTEVDLVRQHADKSISKDTSVYEVMEILEKYAEKLNVEQLIYQLTSRFQLNWIQRLKLRWGWEFTDRDFSGIAKRSGLAADAIKVVANCTAIVSTLMGMMTA